MLHVNHLPADDSHEISSLNHNKNEEIHKGSYMSAHVLLNLLNKLGKRDKMRGLSSILSLFRNEFKQMLDDIKITLKSHF